MSELIAGSSWLVIVLEAIAGLLLLCAGLLIYVIRQHRRDKSTVQSFVTSVAKDLKSRKESILSVCENRFRAGGEPLVTAADGLIEIERDIYKTMVIAFHERDGIALLKVHSGVKKLLWASFDAIPIPSEYGTPENEARFKRMEVELKELEAGNKRLSELLEKNQQEMSQLMEEYQRVFKKSQEAEAAEAAAGDASQ